MKATIFPPLVTRLIPSLGRDNDNEVVTTVRAIASALRNAGQDFHDLARAVENTSQHRATSPTSSTATSQSQQDGVGFTWIARHQATQARTDYDRVAWLVQYASLHLNERELEFVRDLERRLGRYGGFATYKQSTWLDALFSRVARWAA